MQVSVIWHEKTTRVTSLFEHDLQPPRHLLHMRADSCRSAQEEEVGKWETSRPDNSVALVAADINRDGGSIALVICMKKIYFHP
jgi:hypothetical protein